MTDIPIRLVPPAETNPRGGVPSFLREIAAKIEDGTLSIDEPDVAPYGVAVCLVAELPGSEKKKSYTFTMLRVHGLDYLEQVGVLQTCMVDLVTQGEIVK